MSEKWADPKVSTKFTKKNLFQTLCKYHEHKRAKFDTQDDFDTML